METDKYYTKKLEKIIKQMLQPLRDLPFSLVIESISGNKVIPFNKKDEEDLTVLNKLIKVAKVAGNEVNKKGVKRPRPNEVGNDIELFVIDALNKIKYKVSRPLTKSGRGRSTGYPDIEFTDEFKRINYLECKTFNIENVATTQRSFYLSPSEDFKVTKDAHHFVISFEIYVDSSKGVNNIYKCRGWKILSIEDLDVDVKYEFQSDNARLYTDKIVLAEGKL